MVFVLVDKAETSDNFYFIWNKLTWNIFWRRKSKKIKWSFVCTSLFKSIVGLQEQTKNDSISSTFFSFANDKRQIQRNLMILTEVCGKMSVDQYYYFIRIVKILDANWIIYEIRYRLHDVMVYFHAFHKFVVYFCLITWLARYLNQ